MADYQQTLKRILDGYYDDATAEEREQAVRDVVQVCSVAAGAVTFQPIPLLDAALITPIQIAMVQAIGRVHGYQLDRKSVIEILSTFGASLIAQNAVIAAAKLVPILGWLVSISVAYALTYAIGEVSDHYFENGRGVPADDLRTMFKKVYKLKRKEKQEAHKGDSDLKRKLRQLKDAHESGLLTKEEFERKKNDLLEGF